MSDYHIIDVVRKRDKATVAFHIDVPSENNAASKALSDCIVERIARDGADVTAVPNHSTDFGVENAALVAGTVYEYVETISFDANESNANKLAVVEARYTALNTAAPDWLRQEFKFWGYNGDVT